MLCQIWIGSDQKMAIFYNEGETKTRPGMYQRYSNVGSSPTPGAQDGICTISIRASWEPLGRVVRNSYGERRDHRIYVSHGNGRKEIVSNVEIRRDRRG